MRDTGCRIRGPASCLLHPASCIAHPAFSEIRHSYLQTGHVRGFALPWDVASVLHGDRVFDGF